VHTTGGTPGKRTQVEAVDAAAGNVKHYKNEAKRYVGLIFRQKARAIDDMGESLAEKKSANSGLLGNALKFLIPLGAGQLMTALAIEGLAADLFKSGMSAFAGAVANSMGGRGAKPIDPKEFCANYTALLDDQQTPMGNHMAGGIHTKAEGESVVGGLQTQFNNLDRIYQGAQREALDAWTQAMQKVGEKANHKGPGGQGYSDSSTGQLHLDKLLLHIDSGSVHADPDSAKQARMEKVSNDGAKKNAARPLGTIAVERTMFVNWKGWGVGGEFGMGVSPSGKIASDEIGSWDRWAMASYDHGKKLDKDDGKWETDSDQKLIDKQWTQGRTKLWDAIKGSTPSGLGFRMNGD
jgi:hypothetical protein